MTTKSNTREDNIFFTKDDSKVKSADNIFFTKDDSKVKSADAEASRSATKGDAVTSKSSKVMDDSKEAKIQALKDEIRRIQREKEIDELEQQLRNLKNGDMDSASITKRDSKSSERKVHCRSIFSAFN